MILYHSPAKYPRSVKLIRIWHRRWRESLLSVLLIVQIFILFIMPAIRAAGLSLSHIVVYAVLLFFVCLAITLSRSRVAIVTMIVSVILTIMGAIWYHEQPDLLTDAVSATGQVLTQLSLLWAVATAVFGRGPITYHRILGAIVMYLGIGMIFTSLYILLARTTPGAFAHLPASSVEMRETMNYFSFSTMTTASFGDIIPVHPVARSLANLESVCGQLFPATLLARIVGLHSQRKSD